MDIVHNPDPSSKDRNSDLQPFPTNAILAGILTLGLFAYHSYNLWLGGPREFVSHLLLVMAVPVSIFMILRAMNRFSSYQARKVQFTLITLLISIGAALTIFSVTPLSVYLYDLGSERHVRQVSDLDKLQNWANEVLSKPGSGLPGKKQGGYFIFDKDGLPPFVQQIPLKPFMATYVRIAEEKGQRYIWIPVYSGRPHSYGIVLYPQGQAPKPSSSGWIRKWQDSIYGWQGINEIS